MSGFRNLAMRLAAALLMLAGLQTAVLAANYQLNDRVQAYVSGDWYDGTIVGFGEGDYAGEYYVHFDKYTNSSYVQERNLRPLGPPAEPAAPTQAALEPGLYVCTGFDQATYRWSLALGTNGVYQQQKPDTEAGYYSVSGDTVTFQSGNYADIGWFGRIVTESGHTLLVLRSAANEQQGPRVNEYENIYCHLEQ